MNVIKENHQENAYSVTDIITEIKTTHSGCSVDKFYDVAERKYEFQNTTTEMFLDFCITYGFLTSANSSCKISFCLTAISDVNINEEDSIASRNTQEAVSGSAEKSNPKENMHQSFNGLPDKANLKNTYQTRENYYWCFL